MASKYVDKAFDELFCELRVMVEKLRLGEENDLHRALEIIGLIDRNVDTSPGEENTTTVAATSGLLPERRVSFKVHFKNFIFLLFNRLQLLEIIPLSAFFQ